MNTQVCEYTFSMEEPGVVISEDCRIVWAEGNAIWNGHFWSDYWQVDAFMALLLFSVLFAMWWTLSEDHTVAVPAGLFMPSFAFTGLWVSTMSRAIGNPFKRNSRKKNGYEFEYDPFEEADDNPPE